MKKFLSWHPVLIMAVVFPILMAASYSLGVSHLTRSQLWEVMPKLAVLGLLIGSLVAVLSTLSSFPSFWKRLEVMATTIVYFTLFAPVGGYAGWVLWRFWDFMMKNPFPS